MTVPNIGSLAIAEPQNYPDFEEIQARRPLGRVYLSLSAERIVWNLNGPFPDAISVMNPHTAHPK